MILVIIHFLVTEKILLKQSKDHLTRGQKVIGMDGKMDRTLTLKG